MLFSKFRRHVIYIIFFSKMSVLLVLFFHRLQSKFLYTQVKDLLFIILPLFTVYLSILMKFLLDAEKSPELTAEVKMVSGPVVFIGKLLPTLFALYMILVLTLQPAGSPDSFVQMKEMIGLGEVIFGVYIGYIIQATIQKAVAPERQEKRIVATLRLLRVIAKSTFTENGPQNQVDIPKSKLKDLLAKGKIEQTLDLLIKHLQELNGSDNEILLNQVIILSGQFHQYRREAQLNLTDDITIPSRVTYALLDFIDEIN